MALNRTYRILTDHERIPGEDDNHGWRLTAVRRNFWRDALGRDALGRERNGSWNRWLHVVCNVYDCPAEAIVSEAAIVALIPEGTE